jgi:serine/threonine protein kinase
MNEASPSSANCPQCGAAIPQDAPQGLCPKCLLKQASFPTETGHTTRHSRPAPPDRDELARAFPHLQILELIGQGGMGFVYKARQPKLDRVVALKILAQPLAGQTQFAERFTREGRTLAKLNHPNIVIIHDFGQAGPFFYLLMEYVDGVNLRQAMRAGAVDSSQALAIVPRICEALQYAHNEGVLHRDIKPDNILLDTRGRVKIADFGIAKLMAEAVAENPLTGSGASLGTPHYMAPEQIEKPNAVDHRADIYSLGVVFYEMLTGELPLGRFAAPSATSGNDPRLDEIVFQTLEKQPDRRPQSADEVRTRVETISTTPAPPDALPEPAITFKMARCYITSPEFLATWTGRMMKFYGRGDLRLDRENLTYAPNGNWNVIPLRAITQLTLGTSRVGMCHMKILAVTFTEKDQTHRLYFVPNRGPLRSIYDNNDLVEEWFSAVQFAIKSSTGKLPPITRDDLRPTPGVAAPRMGRTFAKGFAVFLVFFTIGLLLLAAILNRVPTHPDRSAPPTKVPPAAVGNEAEAGATRELALRFKHLMSPNTLYFEAPIDLAFNEGIRTMVRYNDGKWDHNNYSAKYQVTRGDNESRTVSLFWTLPENFSFPFDVKPVLDDILDENKTKLLQLSTNRVVEVFSITNALKQKFSCGLQYLPAAPSDLQVATITNSLSQTPIGTVAIRLYGLAPADAHLEPVATFHTNNVFASLTRQGFDTPEVKFALPSSFSQQPGGNLPIVPAVEIRRVVEIRRGQRSELFALTNSDNKVFRAFLELTPFPGATNQQPATGQIPATADKKSFEFNSATPADGYLVLRSETPMKVGQRLTALIEDSSGNVTPAISGLSLTRNRHDLTTSSSAMWMDTPGLATNWIASALEQIEDSMLRKPLHISEGQKIRLFKLKSQPGVSEKFASIRFDTIRPGSNTNATIQARSVYPLGRGFILHFEANVPDGYRLEGLCDPPENGAEARLNVSRINGKDNYDAMWTFDAMEAKSLNEAFGGALTNQLNELRRAPIQLRPGESKTVFTFKAPSREFRAVLKLATPE